MKIVTVLGARPQFIKAAALSRAIKMYEQIEEIIVHTGQHYDENMSKVFFEEMDIPVPKYILQTGGLSHGAMTGQQLEKIEEILLKEKPEYMLVYGDTNSTLAGALAAAKLHIPVIHVEAGLRSFNKKMPEEVNRILVDHISDYLFTTSEVAKNNLLKEGVDESKIYVVGDIMYDVALYYQEKMRKPQWFDALDIDKFALSTIHRAENTDNLDLLGRIFDALAKSGKNIIFPLHPRTAKKISDYDIHVVNNIKIVEPVGYLEMVWLQKHSELIITDSGGLQKEAYFHGKYCITLRNETEWVELVTGGYNSLIGSNQELLLTEINKHYAEQVVQKPIYGEGDTAKMILKHILNS